MPTREGRKQGSQNQAAPPGAELLELPLELSPHSTIPHASPRSRPSPPSRRPAIARPGGSSRRSAPLRAPDETTLRELRSFILSNRPRASCEAENGIKFAKFACKCGFRIHRLTCKKYDCPDCQEAVSKRRAHRALRRLNIVRKGRPIVYTVVTVPLHRRLEFRDPAVWRKFRRGVWRILRDRFGAEIAIENSHPVGDPDEGTGSPEIFHPHLNLVWIPRPGYPGHVNVDVLRHRIRMLLECDTEIDVFTRYFQRNHKTEISRRLQYALRNFPGWGAWAGSAQWFGKISKLPPEDPGECPSCGTIPLYIASYKYEAWDPETYFKIKREYDAQLERDRANRQTYMEDVPHGSDDL